VPFFKKQLENNTTMGFEGMNEKLKELAEKK
ncbi:MAG: SRPBCC domain-containing protein, partial [Sphingobacteriaceae bacterium]